MTVRVLLILLALAAGGGAWQTWRLQSLQLQVAQEKADRDEARRRDEAVATRKTQEVDRATQSRIEAGRSVVDSTRADVDRLRNALIAVSQRGPNAASCADEQAAIERLAAVGDRSARLLARGVEVCRAIAIQVMGQQDLATSEAKDE